MQATNEQKAELINLFNLAKTALAYEEDRSDYARMLWASKAFAQKHEISSTLAYKWLCKVRANWF